MFVPISRVTLRLIGTISIDGATGVPECGDEDGSALLEMHICTKGMPGTSQVLVASSEQELKPGTSSNLVHPIIIMDMEDEEDPLSGNIVTCQAPPPVLKRKVPVALGKLWLKKSFVSPLNNVSRTTECFAEIEEQNLAARQGICAALERRALLEEEKLHLEREKFNLRKQEFELEKERLKFVRE